MMKKQHSKNLRKKNNSLQEHSNPGDTTDIGLDIELSGGSSFYQFIVENSHIGIAIIDDNFTIVYGNKELMNIMGYSLDEIIGADFRDFIAKEHQHDVVDWYQKRQRGENLPSRYEVNTFKKDGTKKTLEMGVAVAKSLAGRVYSVVQIFDITERKKMEIEVKKSRKKYRDIFQNVFDLIFIHDLNGVFLESNAYYVTEMGAENKDFLVGKHMTELMPKKLRPEFDNYLKRIKKAKKDEGLFLVQLPSGRERIVEYRNSLIYDEHATPVGVSGSARDVTDRLRDKKALEESGQILRGIIEGTPIPTFVINEHHVVTHWNEACEKLTGVKAEEIIGTNHHWKAFYKKSDRHWQTLCLMTNTTLRLTNTTMTTPELQKVSKARTKQNPFSPPSDQMADGSY